MTGVEEDVITVERLVLVVVLIILSSISFVLRFFGGFAIDFLLCQVIVSEDVATSIFYSHIISIIESMW